MDTKPTKICTKCGLEKSLEDFHRQKEGKHRKRSMCKLCSNIYNRKWYKENPEQAKRDTRIWYRNRKERWVKSKGNKCQICGYDKCVAALDFHHTNPSIKDGNLDRLPLKKAEKELEKCILVCSNCHREMHYKE